MFEPVLGKAPLTHNDYRIIQWSDWQKIMQAAQEVADAMGYPVYLVGSALYKDPPRDIDISIIVPTEEYIEMFGEFPETEDKKVWDEYLFMVWTKTFRHTRPLVECLVNTHHLDVKVNADCWYNEDPKWLIALPTYVEDEDEYEGE